MSSTTSWSRHPLSLGSTGIDTGESQRRFQTAGPRNPIKIPIWEMVGATGGIFHPTCTGRQPLDVLSRTFRFSSLAWKIRLQLQWSSLEIWWLAVQNTRLGLYWLHYFLPSFLSSTFFVLRLSSFHLCLTNFLQLWTPIGFIYSYKWKRKVMEGH